MRLAALATGFALLPALVLAQDIRVTADSGPLAYFAGRLAGDAATVTLTLPEGEDPSVWRPGVAEITGIQSSDLILLNGAGFSAWTEKTSLPRARTVVTSQAYAERLIETVSAVTHSHGDEGAHSHTGVAPLTWLDFDLAARQMETAAQALTRAMPGATDAIEAVRTALAAELSALDARAADLGARLAGRPVVAARPGLEYLARAYGLDMTTLDWLPGKVPTDDQLAALSAPDGAPPLLLWLETPHPDVVAALQARGVPWAVFDPAADDAEDFPAIMSANLDALEAAIAGQ